MLDEVDSSFPRAFLCLAPCKHPTAAGSLTPPLVPTSRTNPETRSGCANPSKQHRNSERYRIGTITCPNLAAGPRPKIIYNAGPCLFTQTEKIRLVHL